MSCFTETNLNFTQKRFFRTHVAMVSPRTDQLGETKSTGPPSCLQSLKRNWRNGIYFYFIFQKASKQEFLCDGLGSLTWHIQLVKIKPWWQQCIQFFCASQEKGIFTLNSHFSYITSTFRMCYKIHMNSYLFWNSPDLSKTLKICQE